MFITKPVIMLLLSGHLSLASTVPHIRQNGVTCQTSSASPSTEDVTSVINQVRGQGGDCPNTNGAGSGKLRQIVNKEWTFGLQFPPSLWLTQGFGLTA